MTLSSETNETLVVATTNRGKLAELRALLATLPLRVRSADEVMGHPMRLVEDGTTFAENALKKARAVAVATRALTLADDSGLEVDALGGRPGVRSARFAHESASDAENNAALLAALQSLGQRLAAPFGSSPLFPARFRCVLALVDPLESGREPMTVEGVCEGALTLRPRGAAGFGYDSLFVVSRPNEPEKTMAELSEEEKNRVSHRAVALGALRPVLLRVLSVRGATKHRR
ncbi:MAG: non-canonical purine NTP pyrophosphatase [Myxococcota bacterium]|nr:non-canonical purine NTP pyrophosphatase [Myxococcota bacterium]